jgi:hypothetical protein
LSSSSSLLPNKCVDVMCARHIYHKSMHSNVIYYPESESDSQTIIVLLFVSLGTAVSILLSMSRWVVLLVLGVLIAVVSGQSLRAGDSTVCAVCTSICTIVPPESATGIPCYQGAPADTATTFQRDPVIPKGSTWDCDSCSLHGYPNYMRNDPIFTKMELWSK